MIFDTHCHLDYGDDDPGPTIARAHRAGVERLLTVGIDLASSRRARALATAEPSVFHAVGLHPNSAGQLDAEWTELAKLAAEPACVAIGETGLDYYRDRSSPALQKAALRRHLELAAQLDKPVIIHSRDAFTDIFDELAAFPDVHGILHCFSGGVDEARLALDLDYHLSFAGPLTYPRNDQLRAAAAFVPEHRILIETDAPFLPPQAWRGSPNQPAYLVATLECLAGLRGITTSHAATLTTDNACRLLGLAGPQSA